MANAIVDALNMCRFCLCHEDLMPFSQAKSSSLTFEDVLHYTGIVLSENQDFIICEECCISINSAANFRRTCLRNDAVFRSLVSFGDRIAKNNFTVKRVAAQQVERAEKSTAITANESEIITLDDSESDDASPLCEEPVPAGTNTVPPKEYEGTEDGKTSSNDESDVVALDGDDSNFSMASLNGEPTSEALDETIDPKDEQTTTASTSEFDREGTSVGTERDEFPADESDSDYSLPSLYSECMRKEGKIEKPKPIWYECLLCGCKTMDVKRHVQKRHTGKPQCPYCSYQPVNLANHINSMHKAKVTRKPEVREENLKVCCTQCPKKFLREKSLKLHVRKHHDTRPIILTCEECGKGFVNKIGYTIHMQSVHESAKQYECQSCYKKLSLSAYKEHIKEHSPLASKCDDCGKLFKNM
ncbi:AGAP011404-PA-like protein [Anopheles sinensis]|uniref:AGAP011404-PA-like protein n=1 Tax=Anopheles sinensis TaxID=74873 RepID=A0A084WH10_ANOSI|nr:AGAP011404-PA-like protein [Anopheles sinensis]